MSVPLNLVEYESRARACLEPGVFDYYVSGADDEVTLRDSRAAYERLRLRYRVLVDVSRVEAATTVLGRRVAMPVLVAPTAFHRLACDEGERATVRAAGAAGTIMILSSLSNTTIEDVVAAAAGPVWFQLYVYRDREATAAMVRRAEAAGCEAIVLTVDAPRLGRREADVRNGFHLPPGLSVENLLPAGHGAVTRPPGESGLAAYFAALIDPSLSWRDVEWLRGITRLPVVLKGLVRGDDAARAVDAGAAAVIVSNHGGRQLDGSIATIDALPEVVAAVRGRIEVLMDGGIRRGTDVLKALALGARAVCVGRPVLWGLAVGGQAGVEHVLATVREELERAMALCGAPTIAALDEGLVAR